MASYVLFICFLVCRTDFIGREWEEKSLVWNICYMYNIRNEDASSGIIVATLRFSNARPCLPLVDRWEEQIFFVKKKILGLDLFLLLFPQSL